MDTAPRLKEVKVGSRFFGGQSTNHDLVPFRDSNLNFVKMGGTRKIVRETAAYWIDDIGGWWRKSDGLGIPSGPTRLHLVPLAAEE